MISYHVFNKYQLLLVIMYSINAIMSYHVLTAFSAPGMILDAKFQQTDVRSSCYVTFILKIRKLRPTAQRSNWKTGADREAARVSRPDSVCLGKELRLLYHPEPFGWDELGRAAETEEKGTDSSSFWAS